MRPLTEAQKHSIASSIRWARGALTGVESPFRPVGFTPEQIAIRRARQRVDAARDAERQLPDHRSPEWWGLG